MNRRGADDRVEHQNLDLQQSGQVPAWVPYGRLVLDHAGASRPTEKMTP